MIKESAVKNDRTFLYKKGSHDWLPFIYSEWMLSFRFIG